MSLTPSSRTIIGEALPLAKAAILAAVER